MLKTAKPWIYGKEQVVRLSKLQGAMPKLRQMIATWDLDRVYDVRLRHVQLGVKARKLLGENYVPVGALKVRPLSLFLFSFFFFFFLLVLWRLYFCPFSSCSLML